MFRLAPLTQWPVHFPLLACAITVKAFQRDYTDAQVVLFDPIPPQDSSPLERLKVDILDGSGSSADPNSHPFGSFYLDGHSWDITNIHHSPWEIASCGDSGPSVESSTVRIFCTDAFNTSSCSDLINGHTLDTIVKLPPSCFNGNYARVTGFRISQDQNVSFAHLDKKPAKERVYDLLVRCLAFDDNFVADVTPEIDFALDKIDPSKMESEVLFRVDTSNMPGYWDGVVLPAALIAQSSSFTGMDGIQKAERWWHDFEEWRKSYSSTIPVDISAVDLPFVEHLDIAGPRAFRYTLFEETVTCSDTGTSSTAGIYVAGELRAVIIGTLFPTFNISRSYTFLDASATTNLGLDVHANASLSFTSEVVNVLTEAMYGFSYSNLIAIGPQFVIDAYISGLAVVDGDIYAGLQLTTPSYQFSIPDNSRHRLGSLPKVEAGGVSPVFSASSSARGSLSVNWNGAKVLTALGGISFDNSLTFGVETSTATSKNDGPCMYIDGGFHVEGGLSGSILQTAASSNFTIYQSPTYKFYELPAECQPGGVPVLLGVSDMPGHLSSDEVSGILGRNSFSDTLIPGVMSC
ncbi:hypothetical protein V5O48_007365 [Marasmius crinis-equi]|uniref:Acid protease n=1 Tax=Marasmius crinis-equi TaxID=585013 RepID=A0ABR3FHG2_9AGAR